jgi:radical SAM superfamily enzyme YgiQ (UPF0313 family)
MVGFSSTFMPRYNDPPLGRPMPEIKDMLERIRSKSKAKIVVGGSNIKNVLRLYPGMFDAVVYGQGEVVVEKLLTQSPMAYKAQYVPERVYEQDYPHFSQSYTHYDYHDHVEQKEVLTVEVARGCIFKCAYCGFFLNGKSFGDYTKLEQTLYDELMYLYVKYGTTEFIFADDTINDSDQKVDMLLRVSERLPFSIKWHAYARLDAMWKNRDMARKLALAGVRSLTFGIETFDERAGHVIGKGLGRDRTMETLYGLRDIFNKSVKLTSGFILGLPYESVESMHQTFDWLMGPTCPLDSANFMALSLTPGFPSLFSDSPEKYGYTVQPDATWTSSITTSQEMKALAANWTEQIFRKHYFVTPGSFAQLSNIGIPYNVQDTTMCSPQWNDNFSGLQELTKQRESRYMQRVLEGL